MPLISICIPTYNQPSRVDKLLEVINNQWSNNLELIICDDSEGNETQNIVDKYTEIISLKYIKRKRLGLDKAIIDLIYASKGDYIWWIGDDIILPNGIETVINFLENNKPDFLWVNSCNELEPQKLTFEIEMDIITYDPNDLLIFDIGLLGFISATIFKRNIGTKFLDKAANHIGSAWVCLYIIFGVITSGGKLSIMSTPCFSSCPKPSGEVRWYDQFQVFGVNLMRIALNFKPFFNDKKFYYALNWNLERVLKAILVERSLGYKTGYASRTVNLKIILLYYYKFPVFWYYLPFLIMPSVILKFLYIFYIKLIK
jgi:glycosyltransferase involved in cell wall biosynthesis